MGSVVLVQQSWYVDNDLVDYNSDLSRSDSANITIRPRKELEEINGRQFDLVLASAILEHIPAPRQVFIDLLSGLRPGGIFYARTPSLAPILRIFQFLRL